MKVGSGQNGWQRPLKKTAWAAPDVVVKAAVGTLAYGPAGAGLATVASLPASAINLHQAYDEQRRGVGSWKVVGANFANVGAGLGATAIAAASLVDPSLQSAALVAFGVSAGTNVITGVINYASDMGSTLKNESNANTGVALRALGKEAKANWKSGLVQGAKYAAMLGAAGAVAFPLMGAAATLGMNAISEVMNAAVTILTAGFMHSSTVSAAMPSLLELAATGAGVGGAVGLAAGATTGLFPGIKRALAEPQKQTA